MQFDPAVAALMAFDEVKASDQLGEDLEAAIEAEERFSGSAGEAASEAYRELVAIGERHPEADDFGEFLVYTTWCHLMDETHPEHFKRGLTLCQALLRRDTGEDPERTTRLKDIEQSYRAGLGDKPEDIMDFGADTLKGGD